MVCIIALNTNLTQSLVDIELKYDSTTDKPMYRERGADTWLPFSGGSAEISMYSYGNYGAMGLEQGRWKKITCTSTNSASNPRLDNITTGVNTTMVINTPYVLEPNNIYSIVFFGQQKTSNFILE